MLELVDLTKQVSREVYDKTFPDLVIRLGQVQREARAAGVPAVVVFEGWDAAGKGTLINRLTQALDPRGFKVHPVSAPSDAEKLYPWMARFWADLPAAGSFAIFDRSWYGRVLVARVDGLVPKRQWQQAYRDIEAFERQLTDSGVVLVKFWLHISRKEQKRRFERLADNPATAWKVGAEEIRNHRRYRRWVGVVEEMIERTSAAHAQWTIVEATHGRFSRLKVLDTVVRAVRDELARRRAHPRHPGVPMPRPAPAPARKRTVLGRVDLRLSLGRREFERELDALQERLVALEHALYVARIPAVVVYEGWDAAGKGGNIKRLTRGLDPRGYEVIPTVAPTDTEKAHHYLWRFWRHVPKAGHITIFDRSWYGRVLVERVEGFCTRDEWQRAYREINQFERQLADFGTVIVKFWLHIDRAEQLRRFRARARTPHKRWKITDEDRRNRRKWSQYEVAVTEMLQRTSTRCAPWTILEANCKRHARIKALRTVADALTAAGVGA